MTDTVTLPRSVVEQALDALQDANTMMEHRQDVKLRHSAMADLRAALEQPQGEQEPVAWAEEIIEFLHAYYDTEMIKELDSGDALIRLDDAIAAVEEVAQRHAHPKPRQPLTDEEILKLAYPLRWDEVDDFEADRAINFAQTIERAHGIGGEK